jgi:hypothetical protein
MKLTDAKVDRQGRLHVTFKDGHRYFLTAICEGVEFQYNPVKASEIESGGRIYKGAPQPGHLTFQILKQPTVSTHRPKQKKAAPWLRSAAQV